MHPHTLAQLSDATLWCGLSAAAARERAAIAVVLAHIAEVDARRLYLGAGHPSMHAYAVEELRYSAAAAYRRITAARAARAFPALLAAIDDGRLQLSAVCLIAPHLTATNADELIAAATHQRKCEIERWLGERFAPPLLVAMPSRSTAKAAASAAGAPVPGRVEHETARHAPGQVAGLPDGLVPATLAAPTSSAAPAQSVLARHVVLRVALPPATHDKLQHAQRLLSHVLPAGDVPAVLDRALDALIAQLERRRFAATRRPRKATASRPPGRRTVPARVRRAVWQRDGGRCAFVAPGGRRCSARERLEFDHLDPVARGGRAEIDRLRLLCRAHNQFEAERVFGRTFMAGKRAARLVPGRAGVPGRPGVQGQAGVQEGRDRPSDMAPGRGP